MQAIPAIQRRLADAENAILESNSIMKFIRPDLYLSVLDPATEDFKLSAKRFLEKADAVILHRSGKQASWPETSLEFSATRPVFLITPPEYVSDEAIEFVESRLRSSRPALSLP